MQLLRFLLFFSLILYPSANTFATIRNVPSEYNTIQDGIDAALDGDTVLVAPGIYTGTGNTGITFLGKSILVASETGPDSTIIDDASIGFRFQYAEDHSSILRGFTISHMTHGIWINNASPTILDCRLIECVVWLLDLGGGIYMDDSEAFIIDCSFEYCGAGSQAGGSAIYSINGNPSVINSQFFGNFDVDPHSGSILCDDIVIINCTFTNNWPYALYGYPNHTREVINSIFWNNDYHDIHGTAILTYCDIEEGWPGAGNISEDPLFVDPDNFDFRLSVNSPCIDSGDPDSPNVPWGGFRRDMGAFEYDQGFYFDGQNIILKQFPIEIPTLRWQ